MDVDVKVVICHGDFDHQFQRRFDALPCIGDELVLNRAGGIDTVIVQHVEHMTNGEGVSEPILYVTEAGS